MALQVVENQPLVKIGIRDNAEFVAMSYTEISLLEVWQVPTYRTAPKTGFEAKMTTAF